MKHGKKCLMTGIVCIQMLTSGSLLIMADTVEAVQENEQGQEDIGLGLEKKVVDCNKQKFLTTRRENTNVEETSNHDKYLLRLSTSENRNRTYHTAPVKDTQDFIDRIGEDARMIAQKEDLYASVMIAQAILESGNGQSQLSQPPYFNLFGIKGENVSFTTIEDNGEGKIYPALAAFSQYESYEESLQDYADLLKTGLLNNENFYKGAWKSEADNYQVATKFLTGRYATDIHYNEKLDAIIAAYHLTRYDEDTKELPNEDGDYNFPVQNAYVSSQFGKRVSGFHRGIDLAVTEGTPIEAAKGGKVIQSDYHPSWGNYVAIKHEDGLTTLYAHCSRNIAKVGQTVKQGQTIALVGTTGNSTGPHLHFEVNRSQNLVQEQLVDPFQVLKVKE